MRVRKVKKEEIESRRSNEKSNKNIDRKTSINIIIL